MNNIVIKKDISLEELADIFEENKDLDFITVIKEEEADTQYQHN